MTIRISIAVIISALLISACGPVAPPYSETQSHLRVCLEHGYSDAVYASGKWFCKKLVNQSDVVKAYDDIVRER